jgi:fatty acid desaturase
VKIIKVILAILLAVVAVWLGLWLIGLLTSLVYIAIILAVLYLVGLLGWKLFNLSKKVDQPASNLQLDTNLRNQEKLLEAERKLLELKRQQKQ